MMEILGFTGAVFMGITLGLIGGGGSILTVPLLVYFFNVLPVPATAYSLFIVGITSLAGSITYMRRGEISYKTGLIFAIPALLALYATRKFVVPAIPEEIFSLMGISLTKNLLIMLLFALMMLAASFSMIKNKAEDRTRREFNFNYPLIGIEGIVIGFLTGLVGAGGGFLIIPALVLLANLPIKVAVGTSLMIISIKSLVGFIGDVESAQFIDWSLLGLIAIASVMGIIIGSFLTKYIPGKKLKPAFGWFVLVMGVYVIGSEIVQVL